MIGSKIWVTAYGRYEEGPNNVYVEPNPRIEKVAGRLFEVEEAVLHVIERIVAPLGLRVDESSPWVDARLSDGSRVQTNLLSNPFVRDSLSIRQAGSLTTR